MRTSVICRIIHAVHGFCRQRVLRLFLTIQISLIVLAVYCQDVTVINQYNGLAKDENPENYVLKNVTEHTYIINEYELANTGIRSNLEQMISYGLRSYIDNNYHVYDGRIESLSGSTDFLRDARGIVRNAIWIHDQPFADEFTGFSKFIEERVDRILSLDGYVVLGGSNDKRLEQDGEVGLYTFQRMVFDLKKACELEVGFFLDKHLPRAVTSVSQDDNGNYLSSKNYQMRPRSQNINNLMSDKPNFDKLFPEENNPGSNNKRRRKSNKGNNELTERVVELLEQNSKILNSYNDRFENLQKQIDEVRSNSNSEIKDEISDLRSMIEDLSKGGNVKESDGSTTSILPSEEALLIFDKNVHTLSLSQKAILNKSLIVLRQNPSASAFITGYADKTGNAEINAWISQKRAEEVRNYLVSQGIDANRLIVNFLGDAESDSANPLDRKVSVKYLVNSK